MIKSNKLVHGIGFKGMDYPSYDGEKMLKEYDLWKSMLHRCTKEYGFKRSAYAGVTCSENFKSYSFFYEWCNKQVGFKNVDEKGNYWQLDKDLLIKGNKVYSEDVCVFVPQKLPLSPDGQRGQTCLLLPVVAKGEMNQEVASHLIKSSFDYGNDNKRQRIAGS